MKRIEGSKGFFVAPPSRSYQLDGQKKYANVLKFDTKILDHTRQEALAVYNGEKPQPTMESVWELVDDILFQGRQVQPQAKMEQDGKAVVDLFGAGGVQAVEHCRRAGYDQNTAKSISPALAGGATPEKPREIC